MRYKVGFFVSHSKNRHFCDFPKASTIITINWHLSVQIKMGVSDFRKA